MAPTTYGNVCVLCPCGSLPIFRDLLMPFAPGGGGGGGGGAAAAAAPVAAEAPPPPPPKEEKTHVDIKLKTFDSKNKIKVIKEIRAVTSLGLKEVRERNCAESESVRIELLLHFPGTSAYSGTAAAASASRRPLSPLPLLRPRSSWRAPRARS